MLHQLLCFDVAHVSLLQWSWARGWGNRFWPHCGDFWLVSKHRQREEEHGLISQFIVERVDSNSGAETRQGQKKEVGGETETATEPDAAVELEPKYSAEWQGRGEGLQGLWCLWWRELTVCVIVYHISIDHSHPNRKQWATIETSIDLAKNRRLLCLNTAVSLDVTLRWWTGVELWTVA